MRWKSLLGCKLPETSPHATRSCRIGSFLQPANIGVRWPLANRGTMNSPVAATAFMSAFDSGTIYVRRFPAADHVPIRQQGHISQLRIARREGRTAPLRNAAR